MSGERGRNRTFAAKDSLDALRASNDTSYFKGKDALWVKVVSGGDAGNGAPGRCCYDRFMPISFKRSLCLAATLGVGLFGQSGACTSTVTRQLEVFPLTSATLHNTRKLRVWLPPGYHDAANAAKKYPVLYILDGDTAFDSCTAFRHQEFRADETLTELITSGRIPPVIAVGIDSASAALGYNAAGESPDKGEERAREFLAYPDPFSWPGLRDVRGAEFPAFLEHVVMPTIANKYRVMTGAANSALWGDSYAGSAALYIAIHYPLLFDKMIIESPSLQVGNGQLLRDTESIRSSCGANGNSLNSSKNTRGRQGSAAPALAWISEGLFLIARTMLFQLSTKEAVITLPSLVLE